MGGESPGTQATCVVSTSIGFNWSGGLVVRMLVNGEGSRTCRMVRAEAAQQVMGVVHNSVMID